MRFMRRLLSVALLVSLLVGLAPASASALTTTEIRNRVYEKVNNTRRAKGLRPLKVSPMTQTYAKDHAGWLSTSALCKFDVSRLGCHDNTLEVRTEIPSDWEWWGENLASATEQPRLPAVLHSILMKSPGHRANILKARATHMGFGVARANNRVYLVQRFVDRW